MKNSLILAALFTATSLHAATGGKPHWSYSGHEGPAHWGQLDPAYSACAQGRNQSPINLSGFIEADLVPLKFSYTGKSQEILNNGHTVQANFAAGDMLTVDDGAFELKQVHFHAPSENHIDGHSYAMEAHFVHADSKGNLAVVAVMFESGAENPALAKLWAQMPEKGGDKHVLKAQIGAEELMPGSRDYYRFNGSLTTPPCSEGVRWLVMKESLSASSQQISRFEAVMHHANNRPLMPVNARPVLQ
jgi:carbonic anhydrase